MNIDNSEICGFIKESLELIKEKKYHEAITSLEETRHHLPNTEAKYEASDVINIVIGLIDKKDIPEALHVMQSVIAKVRGCEGLRPWAYHP